MTPPNDQISMRRRRSILCCCLLHCLSYIGVVVEGWVSLVNQRQQQQQYRRTKAAARKSLAVAASVRRRPQRRRPLDDDNEYNDWDPEESSSSRRERKRPSLLGLEVDMDEYYKYNDDDEKDETDPSSETSKQQGGFYNVIFDNDSTTTEPLEWELYQDSYILLPPTYVASPRCVIHFCGGTFFGSYPKLWYRQLLEGIVRHMSCVVVATSIPVKLLNNPLQHVKLSKRIQRQFRAAYQNVVVDEYGQEDLENVPIVGLGHSLGARLLTVLATLDDSTKFPPYAAYILMSFTNQPTSASIPGMQLLLTKSRKLESEQRQAKGARILDDDEVHEERNGRKRRRRRQKYFDDDDDDLDEEWDELMSEMQDAFAEQTQRIRNALTPRLKELEFYPSPDQLWKALKDDKRYRIPNTLIVQFDEDEIDQSPRLTDCLLQNESLDLKYARLQGAHLTPISVETDEINGSAAAATNDWLELPTKASQALWKLLVSSRSRQTSTRATVDALRDLRQSIVRYIMDVVTTKTNISGE